MKGHAAMLLLLFAPAARANQWFLVWLYQCVAGLGRCLSRGPVTRPRRLARTLRPKFCGMQRPLRELEAMINGVQCDQCGRAAIIVRCTPISQSRDGSF